ncbi:unnamed protein product [Amoebophrya sp. A120]|nr:unnamed protein product [Amoebophrya sp. A120]|eukprot:GSA120T00019353001.1
MSKKRRMEALPGKEPTAAGPGAATSPAVSSPNQNQNPKPTINLLRLVSACCYAAEKGIKAIRKEKKKQGSTVAVLQEKVDGDDKSCVTKADYAAQTAILNYLRQWETLEGIAKVPNEKNPLRFGLDIVGEEDEGLQLTKETENDAQTAGTEPGAPVAAVENEDPATAESKSLHPYCELLLKQLHTQKDSDALKKKLEQTIPVEHITLFVDPLDGTREFVKNRLQNTQTLIGISAYGAPIAGVIGLPFWGLQKVKHSTKSSSSSKASTSDADFAKESGVVTRGHAVAANGSTCQEAAGVEGEETVLTPLHEMPLGGPASSTTSADPTVFYADSSNIPAPEDDIQLVCGIVGIEKLAGVGTLDEKRLEARQNGNKDVEPQLELAGNEENIMVLATSNDSAGPLKRIKKTLEESNFHFQHVAGAGNKILQILLGKADSALFNLKTSRWDSCAPGALLAVVGGRMMDLFGAPIMHIRAPKEILKEIEKKTLTIEDYYTNSYGVFAYTKRTEELLKEVRDTSGGKQVKHPAYPTWGAKLRAIEMRDDKTEASSSSTTGGQLQQPEEQTMQSLLVEQFGIQAFPSENGSALLESLEHHQCHPQQATDILRDLNGEFLSKNFFEKMLTKNTLKTTDQEPQMIFQKVSIQRVAAPEPSAIRYLMSEACRVFLSYNSYNSEKKDHGEQGTTSSNVQTQSLFLKRSAMRELPHCQLKAKTQPEKLARDVRSYEVEFGFLEAMADRNYLGDSAEEAEADHSTARTSPPRSTRSAPNDLLRKQARLQIPACKYCEKKVYPESPIDSSFLILLSDFSPMESWEQRIMVVEKEELVTAVKALARWHAFFAQSRLQKLDLEKKITKELKSKNIVWENGTFWASNRQSASMYENVEKVWKEKKFADRFCALVKERLAEETTAKNKNARADDRDGLELLPEDALQSIGANLQKHTKRLAFEMHEEWRTEDSRPADKAEEHFITLLHGDPKAANMFFRRAAPAAAQDEVGTGTTGGNIDPGEEEIEFAFIDFQWTGWGLPMVDLAYMLAACAGPELLDLAGTQEKELLLIYYEELKKQIAKDLMNKKKTGTVTTTSSPQTGTVTTTSSPHHSETENIAQIIPPMSYFQNQYEKAFLDHCTTVFTYMWPRFDASVENLEKRKTLFAANPYNKNARSAAWLMYRCYVYLEKMEYPACE